jgi:plastocyanin
MRSYRFPELAVAIFLLLAGAAAPAVATNFTIGTDLPYGYSPSTVTITAGDSVTWMNTSQGYHNVHADDNSFRCANGCDGDGHGGDGDPSYNAWQFTMTFTKPGSVSFHCDIHGSMGMVGTITVNPAAGGGGSPGSLSFTQASYSADDTAGSAAIAVKRTGGSSGAVSVKYATSNGTAVSGTNYQAASGTLNWADGDAASKSFPVPVINDGKADGNHTVLLALSAPAGGASLGTAAATLTISNTNTASPPAAPTNLTATPLDSTDVQLTWTVNSNNETDFRVQSKTLNGGSFQDLLPLLPAGSSSLTVTGLQPATGYGFQLRAENAAGASAYTPEADATTSPAAGTICTANANTLCLGTGGRFQVTVSFVSAGQSGLGTAVPLAANPSSGLFYFFASDNIEMLIKVLNACAPPFNAYWVFFAATTNVEFTVTVLDTQTSKVRIYSNPLNQAALPVQDTSAFLTCP